MTTSFTKQHLLDFETDIANEFNSGRIKAPVHLYNGNEDEMIEIFDKNKINENDWVFCTWRSHYQCLLKGVPPKRLKEDILAGKSITLCYPEYKIFSSAIVTGTIPIAVGAAMGLKMSGAKGKVYVFVGDMTSETGVMWENFKYAISQDLPIKFIVEDNNKSVCTDTRKTWNCAEEGLFFENLYKINSDYLEYYKYESKYPHAGAGKRIQF